MLFDTAVFRRLFVLGLTVAWGIGASLAIAAPPPACLAWAERDAGGVYRMRFSRHDGQSWSPPVFLSNGGTEEILPAVASDALGNIWVAWTELRGVHGVIRYNVYSAGAWSRAKSLETATISDLAPSLAKGPTGLIWMVFSGSDGTQDDVYAVYWLGRGWSVPEKVHPDNRTPDILPRIGIDDANGRLRVVWRHFDGMTYRTVSSTRDDAGWSLASSGLRSSRAVESDGMHAGGRDHCAASPPLPDFVGDLSQAVLHVRFPKPESIRLEAGVPCP